jgi:predicted esterase
VAGIKTGDRLMKIGSAEAKELRPFSGRDELRAILESALVGSEIKLEVQRKADDKTETVKLRLSAMPAAIPDSLPPNATARRALEPRKHTARPQAKNEDKPAPKLEEKKVETGYHERSTPAKDHSYWIYVPANYDPNVSHALVIWLHAAGQGGKDANDMVAIWRDVCEEQHIILVGPKSESETGWLASESEFVQEAAREVLKEFTIDRQRVVAHGMGVGGQLAFYLGLNARDLIRGVATTGAVLATSPKDNLAGQRLSFFVVAGAKDPLVKDIAEVQSKLTEKKLPVIYREVADMGKEYLDRKTFEEMIRWIDSLDRL